MRFRRLVLYALVGLIAVSFGGRGQACAPPGRGSTGRPGCCQQKSIGASPLNKPWVIDGLGSAPFPITTTNPEVQKWFDQGNALLACFWDLEAERAFRWCLKLDPNCAMAYWGLARAVADYRDPTAEIQRARGLKAKVSVRERMYIDAWAEYYLPEISTHHGDMAALSRRMEAICATYPDDVEAKAIVALLNLTGEDQKRNETYLQAALAANPNHVGAHHFRVHTWDHLESASRVLDSVEALRRLAPGSPHILHMPGHIYSKLGRWHDAEAAMEAAATVEARYLREHLLMPFSDWNYAHNRSYLSYIQEQLGMADAAIAGAEELCAAPADPEMNDGKSPASILSQGRTSLIRALVKFERWPAILDGKTVPWGDSPMDVAWKSYSESRAWIGSANLAQAVKAAAIHRKLRSKIRSLGDADAAELYAIQSLELTGRLELARKEIPDGLGHLREAAKRESEFRRNNNDPPVYPTSLFASLGEAYLAQSNPAQAVVEFQNAIQSLPEDGFALAGLVQAYHALKKTEEANDAWVRFESVWSAADANLRWLQAAHIAANPAAQLKNPPPKSRRDSGAEKDGRVVESWGPPAAPRWRAEDLSGNPVGLEEYAGRNVLLVFCAERDRRALKASLKRLEGAAARLGDASVDVVAILESLPEVPRGAAGLVKDAGSRRVQILTDPSSSVARECKAYDDFADAPVNATLLIDALGRIRWSHYGGFAFKEFDFLVEQATKLRNDPRARLVPSAGH